MSFKVWAKRFSNEKSEKEEMRVILSQQKHEEITPRLLNYYNIYLHIFSSTYSHIITYITIYSLSFHSYQSRFQLQVTFNHLSNYATNLDWLVSIGSSPSGRGNKRQLICHCSLEIWGRRGWACDAPKSFDVSCLQIVIIANNANFLNLVFKFRNE